MEVDNSSLLDRIARDTPAENDEPQASTSAVTLDNGLDTVKPQSVQLPRRPWGLADYGIPPPPSDILPDPAVEAKLRHFHTLRAQGVYFNNSLQSNKSFRNPSILSKLVDFVNVDEKLSAMPADVWSSSHGVSSQAWAASIAERQKQLNDERERIQARGKRSAIDFTSSSSSNRPRERIRMPEAASSSSKSGARQRDDRTSSKWDRDDSSRRSEGAPRRRDRDGRRRTRSRSPVSRHY